MNIRNLKMIDLCSGTGAFSLAFESTGLVDVIYSNDIDESSKTIYDYNFKHNLDLNDLNKIQIENIPKHDIITVGMNCQPWSLAGERKGFNDPRAKVLLKVIEILNFHKPECIVFENVKNLLSHDKGKSFQRIRDKIEKAGYSITYKVLNTSEITGIPQHRERVYLVGVRNEDILDEFNLNFQNCRKT